MRARDIVVTFNVDWLTEMLINNSCNSICFNLKTQIIQYLRESWSTISLGSSEEKLCVWLCCFCDDLKDNLLGPSRFLLDVIIMMEIKCSDYVNAVILLSFK